MSVSRVCGRAHHLSAGRLLAPRALHAFVRPSPAPLALFRPHRCASLHTSRFPLADDEKSTSTTTTSISADPNPAEAAEQHDQDGSDAERLSRALAVEKDKLSQTAEPPSSSSALTASPSTDSSDELIASLASVDWTNRFAVDETLYSDDMQHITTRLAREQPLTVSQKITLLQFWLDKLNKNPASFPVHPALTWTHPRGAGQRPGREAPRMEERYVEVPYEREEVERLTVAERLRERRGVTSQYEAERRAYALKVSDVRRAYMAEWRAVKERRDADILRQWRATKASSAARRQRTTAAHQADEGELERAEEERYQHALQARKQRVEVRVRKEEAANRKRAAQLLHLLEQQKAKGVNHSADASWGVRIDETLFAQTNRAVVGFWPSSIGARAQE